MRETITGVPQAIASKGGNPKLLYKTRQNKTNGTAIKRRKIFVPYATHESNPLFDRAPLQLKFYFAGSLASEEKMQIGAVDTLECREQAS